MRLLSLLVDVLPLAAAAAVAGPAADLALASADCAASSKTLKAMVLRSWKVWHAVTAHAHLRGTFAIFNPGPGDEYQMNSIPFADDSTWHKCEGSIPKQVTACEYIYDIENVEIGFKFQWSCAGGNKPTVFSATAVGPLGDPPFNLTIRELNYDGKTS